MNRRGSAADLARRNAARFFDNEAGASAPTLPTTGLLAAYDARAGVTNVSGACSAWADQSGNGWHASQATAGKRPTISSTGGFPSLLFSNSGASALSVPGISASAGVKTVYCVQNATVAAGYASILDVQTGRMMFGHMAGTNYGVHDGTDRNSGIVATVGLSRLTFECTTGSARVWRNGTVGATAGFTANRAVGGNVAIGANNTQSGLHFNGHILFLAIYNATRNTNVEAYITQEWGV